MKWQLEHIGLPSISPENLARWYVSKLEGKVKLKGPGENPAFFVEVAGTIIEIYLCGSSLEQTGNNSLAGFRHLALRVDAIEPAMKELVLKGVEFREPIKEAGGGGRVVFFKDPEGNLLHLVERPEGSIFQ
ncbi:MAG: glyoxalase/bleomycin resistance protein/dioxygenase [Verrucomicrobiales bacterium]|nr:glyoxalase/bleomycin resistance protein/dioxygenase [Verrucomicrobiales bacterium]